MLTEVVPVTELDGKLYHYLYQLNFRGRSPMQRRLSLARKGRVEGFVVLCKQDDEILGWCLVWYEEGHYIGRPVIYFYVKRKHRRRGIGSLLMRTAYRFCQDKWNKGVAVWVHDSNSSSFFAKATGRVEKYHSDY